MSYLVLIQPPATRDLASAYHWIARRSPDRAESWVGGAIEAILTLKDFPDRCPLAPESAVFQIEIRQLLYRDFRILFAVDGDSVRVLHVRHGARRFLAIDELEWPDL